MQMYRQTDRQDEANGQVMQFCKRPKYIPVILRFGRTSLKAACSSVYTLDPGCSGLM